MSICVNDSNVGGEGCSKMRRRALLSCWLVQRIGSKNMLLALRIYASLMYYSLIWYNR